MNKRGMALILGFTVIVVLTVLGLAIISRSISENNITKRFISSTRAFWLAEAGVQRAFWELSYNSCQGCTQFTNNICTNNPCTDCSTCGDKCITGSLLQAGVCDYYVLLNSSNSSITSTGYFPSRTALDRMARTIRVSGEYLFNYAVFGRQSVSISGNASTDSYDSSKGNYGGSNKGANGDVGTNGATPGAITLSGGAKVYGDAITGPGGTVSISGGAQVVPPGTITDQNNVNLPAVVVPSALQGLSPETYNGTISPGDHKYSSIAISGSESLNISSSTKIYLTGSQSLNISGSGGLNIASGAQVTIYTDGGINISSSGIVNQSRIPTNLILYGTPSCHSITLSGSGDFYGAIYAPDASISKSGSSLVYGALIGNQVSIPGSGDLHYDENLKTIEGSLKYTWQEI